MSMSTVKTDKYTVFISVQNQENSKAQKSLRMAECMVYKILYNILS